MKIEKGIPIPPKGYVIYGELRSAILRMSIGDSFIVANERERLNALAAARNAKRYVTTRKVDGGFRIWRVDKRDWNKTRKHRFKQPFNSNGPVLTRLLNKT